MTLDIHNWSSTTHQELHKIVKDEIFPIINQVDARVQNFEIQFLKEVAKFVRDFKSLAKEADESRGFGIGNRASLESSYKYNDKRYLKNAKLRARLFDKVSEQKDTNIGTSVNTQFLKQSILGKPPSSSKPKLYFVTPFPNSMIIPKVSKTNALSKPVTSNSAPSSRESTVVNNERVIAPGIFRINPFKASRVDNFVPNKHVKASVRTKLITVSQPHVITKNDVNSKTNGFSPKDVKSTTRTKRPQPRNNPKSDKVPFKSKSSCLSNKLEKIEENHRSLQSSNYLDHASSECKNIKLAIRNEKFEVICATWSKERLALPKPSTHRSCLRWSPTGRMFDLKGKIIATSESVCQSDYSKGDNACTSNPQEPIKRFPNSTFSMTGCQNWLDNLLIPLLFEYKPKDKENHEDNECDS
ncbi:hypothetical protein Tco_0057786 [Tanacetum coccineum]